MTSLSPAAHPLRAGVVELRRLQKFEERETRAIEFALARLLALAVCEHSS
jgi:hypothetical protein